MRHILFGLLILLAGGCVSLPEAPGLQSDTLVSIEEKYGVEARARVQQWRYLIEDHKEGVDTARLEAANRLFNGLEFVDDKAHWQREDYWATPIETLASNGGDCEDFVIGKYFTLREMGVAERCLRLTYVKSISRNLPHMVLNYQCDDRDQSLVLDNLTSFIMPASERTDLLPVYSFNGEGLWLAKQQGMGRQLGDADRLSLWLDLLRRHADSGAPAIQ